MTIPAHLIDRKEIECLLKKSRALTADLLQAPGAPKEVTRINGAIFYRRCEVMAWLAGDPYQQHRLAINRNKAAVPVRTDRARPSKLDNAIALRFLIDTAPRFVGPIKHGRTQTVHLTERNDYTLGGEICQ